MVAVMRFERESLTASRPSWLPALCRRFDGTTLLQPVFQAQPHAPQNSRPNMYKYGDGCGEYPRTRNYAAKRLCRIPMSSAVAVRAQGEIGEQTVLRRERVSSAFSGE
jgi:hypothetical protein